MSQVIFTSAPTIDASELRAALEGAFSRHFGAPRQIAQLERRPSAYCTSFAIEELDVRLDDGSTLELVLKDLSWRSLSDLARRAKPVFLYDPLREIAVYRTILLPRRLGTATCYGAVIDHALGRYWLLLEKVPGVELYQVGELATWQRVARWLAAFHAQFAEVATTERLAAPLLRHDGNFYQRWARRARAFSHRADPAVAPRIEWLTQRYERVVERLVALPPTFIHGEFYASNVLVQETAEGLRVCPVDWEMAALGPGLIDLAALTAGIWTDEQRQALALAYRDALSPITGRLLDVEALLVELDCCRLHLAVQWLGWSPDWSPPPEHAQDWLGEAVGLTEKLGL
jgi:Ser/Thr protein kinase RdoA (MazF antagonist)